MAASLRSEFGGISQAESEAPAETGAAGGKRQAFVERRSTNRCQVVFVNGVDDRITNTLSAKLLHFRADRRCTTVYRVKTNEANFVPRLSLQDSNQVGIGHRR